MKKTAAGCLTLVNCAILFAASVAAQVLPAPAGKYGIGYHRLEWTDSSRIDSLSGGTSFRRLIGDVWYPAVKAASPDVSYIDTHALRTSEHGGLASLIGGHAATKVITGQVKSHAKRDAAFDPQLYLAPVIFFSHGMGMITQLYTAQIEELVSHGYIVIALSHPHDAWLASFDDGTVIPFETNRRSAAGSSDEAHVAYEDTRIAVWADDIRFALTRLEHLNQKIVDIPFAGHMDLSLVGALGHSSGGRAAARACQLDDRIKSCADQDGVAMMQPFYVSGNGAGMRQPFLLFERVTKHVPGQAEALSMGMTLPELNALVKKLRDNKKRALSATGGAYHVLLHFDSSSHMSFSDLPLLQSTNEKEYQHAMNVLKVTCRYTREFFDKTVCRKAAPLYDRKTKLRYIEVVERYPRPTE